MKKISRILMCASLLLGFAACSDSDSGDDGDNNGTQLAAPVLAQSSVEETAFTVTSELSHDVLNPARVPL